MRPEDYLIWLNKQIGLAISREYGDLADAFAMARDKFLAIKFPTQQSEDETLNNFTDGLDE